MRLGSQVTLVASQLLPNDEPEAGAALEMVFADEGMTRVNGRVKSVVVDSSVQGGHVLTVEVGGETSTVTGDTLLVAVGREPVVDGIALKSLGMALDPTTGGILVDQSLRTSVKGVYAAGDCTGDQQFTHYAGFQGAYAAVNAFLPLGPLSFKGVLAGEVPGCTFTSPEVARVGLTEVQARAAAGRTSDVAVKKRPLLQTDRALCDGEEAYGFVKIVYQPSNGRVLGATVASPRAGEMISEFAVALKKKLTLTDLANALHPYPSYSWVVQLMAAEVYTDSLSKLYVSLVAPLKGIRTLFRRLLRSTSG
mmetsp:Transcript_56990/g.94290  ORF Transcript_56990/g.94290 Transcript_56990/m.94290 type:complete len:308 (+) Transcript_56990:1-924(+)